MIDQGPLDDDTGLPIYGSGVNYFPALRGRVGETNTYFEQQIRGYFRTNRAFGGTPEDGGKYYLVEKRQYPPSGSFDGIVTATYHPASDPANDTFSYTPTSGWSGPFQHISYSSEYTAAEFQADATADIAEQPWTAGEGAEREYGPGDDFVNAYEARFRFGYRFLGSAPNATVKFRWRKRRVTQADGFSDAVVTWDGEETATVNVSATPGEIVWTDWFTILLADMADYQTVTIVGPDDTSYIGITPTVSPVLLTGRKLNGGFPGYITPQVSTGTLPQIEVYDRETASAAPGTATAFSGEQHVVLEDDPSVPVYAGDVVDTFAGEGGKGGSDVRLLSSTTSGGTAAYGGYGAIGAFTRLKQTKRLDFLSRQYDNGLIMTLSQPVDDSAYQTATEDYLAAVLARTVSSPPPFPKLPLWTQTQFYTGNSPVSLLGKNWDSPDGTSCIRARAKFAVATAPFLYFGGLTPITYTVSWDVVTQDLATGARSVATQSATFSHDYDSGDDPPPYIYGPVITPLPAQNTQVYVENFRVSSPQNITELGDGPVYEVTPG